MSETSPKRIVLPWIVLVVCGLVSVCCQAMALHDVEHRAGPNDPEPAIFFASCFVLVAAIAARMIYLRTSD